ncbi:MAG: winged helix-turn-helix domain-containing protein [Candidatus Pacebacteria bacterium]|nr:winged helix-turn-helix domain-containing protein [Candidatus Paceibacterota bacterium]
MNQTDSQDRAGASQPTIAILAGNQKLRSVISDMISRGADLSLITAEGLIDLPNLEGIKILIFADPSEPPAEIAQRLLGLKPAPKILCLNSTAKDQHSGWLNLPIPISRRNMMRAIEQALAGERAEAILTAKDHGLGSGRFIPSKRLIIKEDSAEEIRLTEKESAILELLLDHGQAILSRDRLYNQIWGRAANVTEHTIDSHLYRLRRKLAPLGCELLSADSGYCLKMK